MLGWLYGGNWLQELGGCMEETCSEWRYSDIERNTK